MPPISSTTRSLPWRMPAKSPRERVSTPVSSGLRPVTAATASARSASSVSNAAPTVPWPSSPTLNVSGIEVLVGLAPDDDAGVTAGAEDHRRPGDAVVVVGHRVPVGAGDRRHEHVAGPRVGESHVAHQHVA